MSAKSLILVLGDQLTASLPALTQADPTTDVILMAEVMSEATYVAHHPQKIVMIFSAMRNFAQEMRGKGFRVVYQRLDDATALPDLAAVLQRAVDTLHPTSVHLTEVGEYRLAEHLKEWAESASVPVTWHRDTRFFSTPYDFAEWAKDRKSLRMEFFYREMRRKTGLLMDGKDPCGGEWNFDSENRAKLPKNTFIPIPPRLPHDAITQEVMALVKKRFGHHFGDLDSFDWPVTRADALVFLNHFIAHLLPQFGTYQDTMVEGEPFLFHSRISAALNIGLLTPLEVCKAAEAEYRAKRAPLNAVEGFIRQILGWREYVRGLYWLKMPDYAQTNFLNATRPLPAFYWGAPTPMNCIKQCVRETRQNAYAHHIQRLMVLGNFALLAGIDPKDVQKWYLEVYIDAFEWVELPNVHGMALFADGGIMASKPYAGSGAYINKMSDYCGTCAYDVKQKTGAKACPFNYLYWDFLQRNDEVLRGNPRLAMPYRTLHKMPEEQKNRIKDDAALFLQSVK
jgi:deoxyribodipyrimidine photolyase-related protein